MYINTFKYKPEDVSCVLCTEYVKKLGCTALSCPCLAERMEAGTVGYAEAVAELFPYRPRLTARIMRLAESFPGTMWQDDAHRKRMETLRLLLGCRKERDTPEFFAVHPTGEDYRIYLERYFSGYRRAAEAGRKAGLRVFPGLEVRLYDGPEDYLVYGVSPEQLAELPCLAFLSLEELHAAVRSVPDGLLVQAHPFRDYLTCQDARCLDGIEVCNANPRHDSHNDQALAYAQAHGLLMTAGSDVHQVGDAGGASMVCPPFSNGQEFARLLRQGRAAWRSGV